MKKTIRLLFFMLLVFSSNEKSYSQTFDVWRAAYGLTESERNSDKDDDGYSNFTEYALGMNPLVIDTVGRDIFVSKVAINKDAITDVFWQVWRAYDYTPTALYPDWEITNSKEGTGEWIGDYVVEDIVNDSGKYISITVPTAYSSYTHRLVAMDTEIFPDFDENQVNIQPMVRGDMGEANYLTAEDHQFFADHPYGGGELDAADIAIIKAMTPNFKAQDYVNSGIVIGETYSLDTLPVEDYVLWDETSNAWGIYSANNPRYIFDWRKPAGVNIRKKAVTERMTVGVNAKFVDAWVKAGVASTKLIAEADQKDYLEAYFDFLTWLQNTQTGIRVLNIDVTEKHVKMYNDFTSQFYTTTEGPLNAYFNAFYDESYDKETADELADRIDWTINKWTRHGKIYLHRGEGLDLDDQHSVFLAAYYLTVMGKHSYYMGTAGANNYGSGGWMSPEWIENVTWRPMGAAKSVATKDGYIYTREFEYTKVICNVETKTCLIKWYNLDGTLNTTWGTHPDILPELVTGIDVTPDSVALFIGTAKELSTTFSPSIATNKNLTWSSSDTTIAKVDSSGVVTSTGLGSTVITATTEDGGFQDSCVVTVGNINVTSVNIIQENDSLNSDDFLTLNATVSPSNATVKSIIWSSSDSTIAKVNSSGVVSVIYGGTVVITATTEDGGFTDNCTITSLADPKPEIRVSGYYQLLKSNGQTMCVYAGEDESMQAGDGVSLFTYTKDDLRTIWAEIDHDNGYYSYQKLNTNFCLDAGDGGANSQKVVIAECDLENKNQQWEKEVLTSGNIRLKKRDVDFVMNSGSGAVLGQEINLWKSSATSGNLEWVFSPAFEETNTLIIQVTDSTSNQSLSNVSITLNSETSHTGVTGEAIFSGLDLSENYTYTLSKEGYNTINGNIDITRDSTLALSMTLVPTASLTITVVDSSTSQVLSDVHITLNNETQQTGVSGEAIFTGLYVFENYTYTLSKQGYNSINGNIDITKDSTLALSMTLVPTASLTITVIDSSTFQVLSDVEITLDNETKRSGVSGEVVFSGLDIPENYTYILSKQGYNIINGNIDITKDSTLALSMTLVPTASLTITVIDSSTSQVLSDVEITLDNESKQSGVNGEVVFSGLDVPKNYTYTLSKEGYNTINGNIDITKDSVLNINMISISSDLKSNSEVNNSFYLSPNPTTNKLYIELNGFETAQMSILNNAGQTVIYDQFNNRMNAIDVITLPAGVYIIKVTNNSQTLIKKFIKE